MVDLLTPGNSNIGESLYQIYDPC